MVDVLGGRVSTTVDTDTGVVVMEIRTDQPPPATITLTPVESARLKEALGAARRFLEESDAHDRDDPLVNDGTIRAVGVHTVRNGHRRDGYVSLTVTEGETIRTVTVSSEAIHDLVAVLGPPERPSPG